MTVDELIKYCEEIAERNKGIAEFCKDTKCTTYKDGWEEIAARYFQIADWLKVLKDIQSTGCCNECKSKGVCKYEPEAGQVVRYNCPFYIDDIWKDIEKQNGERRHKMTYGDIYYEFCKKFPNAEVSDFRPAMPQYFPHLVKPIPYAIIVWLKDGSKVVYIAESEE